MLFISLGTPGSAKIIVPPASRRTPGAVPAVFSRGGAPRGSRAIFLLAEVSFRSPLPDPLKSHVVWGWSQSPHNDQELWFAAERFPHGGGDFSEVVIDGRYAGQ